MDEGQTLDKSATETLMMSTTPTAETNLPSTIGLLGYAPVISSVPNDATSTNSDNNKSDDYNTTPASGAVTVKTLKRCLSVPIIHTLPVSAAVAGVCGSTSMTTRSAAAAAAAAANRNAVASFATANQATAVVIRGLSEVGDHTPKKYQTFLSADAAISNQACPTNLFCSNISIPRSNPCSREVSPAPVFNIFAPRARRYSASYSPLGASIAGTGPTGGGAPLCITPRVSQLRKEECVDMNSREVNHEREVHSAMQMSQSWEDLTLVAENWSCKSDEFSNPLQVVLPSSVTSCSSPSPTSSHRGNIRLPYGLSPSPTRRTFATRRSMSPIAMRPSQLGPVKRKFELEDASSSNWNVYSPPPLKKIFTESRGSSPICQSPSSVCPSPDSGTYDGRSTPKLFISKLCTTGLNSGGGTTGGSNTSACSSPMSASPNNNVVDSTATSTALCSSSLLSHSGSSSLAGSEPMNIGTSSIDEGISISDTYDKCASSSSSSSVVGVSMSRPDQALVQPMSTELQDESTLMDDMKSETSSIGGCSSISIESSSCDSGAKTSANFFHKFALDDPPSTPTTMGQKSFFINKQGVTGPRKFIVNHDNLTSSISNGDSLEHSIKVSHNITPSTGMKTRRSNFRNVDNKNDSESTTKLADNLVDSVDGVKDNKL